tara:strand:- start:419 stop:559 length:141 start_codon:yes stop_codon:yes gene_type:complete
MKKPFDKKAMNKMVSKKADQIMKEGKVKNRKQAFAIAYATLGKKKT